MRDSDTSQYNYNAHESSFINSNHKKSGTRGIKLSSNKKKSKPASLFCEPKPIDMDTKMTQSQTKNQIKTPQSGASKIKRSHAVMNII